VWALCGGAWQVPSRAMSQAIVCWIVASAALLGCRAYDPELLEPKGAIAGPVSVEPPGSDGPATAAGEGGARDPGADAGQDATSTSVAVPRPDVCGDGRVSGQELCDTGIEDGEPGACPPAVCTPLSECTLRARRGMGCQAACVLLPEVCEDGDRCCPGACTKDNDSDCSQSCGDGEIQQDVETCEDGTGMPCPTEADCRDDDPCTTDILLGSAANCNAQCSNEPITTLVAGDACCPPGANANSDSDCVARCGNGVREGDEECDGTPGCTGQCELRATDRQEVCLSRFASDACLECACTSCTEQVFDCFDGGDAARDMHCSAINTCGRDNDCAGISCYCGDSPGCLLPNGACVDEIHAAAPNPDQISVELARADPEHAIGRASLLSACTVTNCSDVCP